MLVASLKGCSAYKPQFHPVDVGLPGSSSFRGCRLNVFSNPLNKCKLSATKAAHLLPTALWVTFRACTFEWGLRSWSQLVGASKWLSLYEISWQKTEMCKQDACPQALPLPATLSAAKADWPYSAFHLCYDKGQLYLHFQKATISCRS